MTDPIRPAVEAPDDIDFEPHEAILGKIVRALASADGLIYDEVCGYDDPNGHDECDSGTCVAAYYEDHDAEWARSVYRRAALYHILPLILDERAKVASKTNRFYIDCEFDGHNGPLLSMAIISESDDSIHIKTTAPCKDDWVFANVLSLMDQHKAAKSASVGVYDVGKVVRAFIGDCATPIIVADSPVDIGRFCQALSTGVDGGWESADYPFMSFEVHNVDCYPTNLAGAVQHNAWWDAMALKHKLHAIERGDRTGGGDGAD